MSNQAEREIRRRSDKLELQKRIRVVQDYILQDHLTVDIINQCIVQWNVTERQAYRYLWAAKLFFIEKDKSDVEKKKAIYLARKKKLLRDMDPQEKKTAAGVSAINRVLDSMAKLEGVTYDTVKLIGDPDNPVHTVAKETPFNYSNLSEKELLTLKKLHDKAAQH